MSTMQQVRAWQGPAVLSYGFRPFFFLAGLWAACAMILWLLTLTGHTVLATAFDPFTWHAHEFVFGYVTAVIAGFLLTAVPNWTGRLPVVGWPLAGLVALWLAGRAAVAFSAGIPALAVAFLDLSFTTALLFFLAREILIGRNWRNLPVLGLLSVITVANGLFHWQAAHGAVTGDNIGLRLALAGEIMLIALIGGRIVPSFTRNWLVQRKASSLPAPAGPFDHVSLLITGAALISFAAVPEAGVTALLCAVAGAANLMRLSRWQGQQTLAEPLLWVLHAGYAFLALGFLAVAAAAAGYIPLPSALHVWLAGAIGVMTVAVMTRATRGHTGRALTAPPLTLIVYLLLIASVVLRLAAGVFPTFTDWGWGLAALAWIGAFGLYLLAYGAMHLQPAQPRPR